MENTKHQHFAIYKPDGYLSQFVNNEQRKNKKKLLRGFYSFPENIMAIGRLDEDSEGLLLLTTDGMMSELVRSKKVEKVLFFITVLLLSNLDFTFRKIKTNNGPKI